MSERVKVAPASVLWRAHAQDLVRFATVLVGPGDAYDIVVDAFLRCEPVVASGQVESPRAYLLRAVHNRARDV